jgi:hypothetical protein
MNHFMRGMLAAALCLCSSALLAAGAQHTVELASSTAVLDEPLRAVLHLRPWDAAQFEYPVNCLQAEVRYGDFVVPPGQLQVSAVPMPEVGYVRVAIFSPLVVSEPLVYLRLTLSCDPQLEQQWTLFSEPGDSTLASTPKAAAPEPVWTNSVAGLFPAAPQAVVPPPSLPVADPVPPQPAHVQRTALSRLAVTAPASQLRLEPADHTALAQAMRALWQQQGQAQYELLESRLAALHQENELLQARMGALQTLLEQRAAQPGGAGPTPHWQASATWVLRDLLPWLSALVLVASLAWFLHWLGSDRESPWRGDVEMARARLRQAMNRGSAAPPLRPAVAATLSPRPAVSPAPSPAPTALCTATVEHTLPDEVQAQADEFIQAGHLGAVALLLEVHLRSQAQKSAPMLLNLLDIYQEMGQDADAARVAALLSRLFNLRDPLRDQAHGEGLEGHPATLHSITTQWNQPSVLEVLKNLLLRPTAVEELSLAAFRDVLALYEMARLRDASGPDRGLDWE